VPVAEGAAYNEGTNTTYLNTNYLKPSSDVVQSIVHETQRKLFGDANKNKPLRNPKEEKIATLRGKIGTGTWDIIGGGNKNPIKNYSTHTRTNWQKKNQELLNKGNLLAESSNYRDLKPRVIEKLDRRYCKAKAEGDLEEMARLEWLYGSLERKLPVVGSLFNAYDDLKYGEYLEAVQDLFICGRQLAVAIATKGKSLIGDAATAGLDLSLEQLGISRNKSNGRNDPHANLKAKDTAYKEWVDAKAEVEPDQKGREGES
jgi:hypothetical protein